MARREGFPPSFGDMTREKVEFRSKRDERTECGSFGQFSNRQVGGVVVGVVERRKAVTCVTDPSAPFPDATRLVIKLRTPPAN